MEPPSHRACVFCRAQKLRCLPDETNPDKCVRCSRSGRQCVHAPLQKRKQRKRTDTRVKELEEQMEAMRVLLREKNDSRRVGDGSDACATSSAVSTVQSTAGKVLPSRVVEDAASSVNRPILPDQLTKMDDIESSSANTSNPRTDLLLSGHPADIVDRGVVSISTACQLLLRYQQDLYPHFPVVYIPASTTVEHLRSTRPTLFLAVMAAASGADNADLATKLDREVLQEYARRTVVNSEKTVELVQSLMISAVWYQPPSRFAQLKYYEYIHMASAMAVDIGLCTRPAHAKRGRFHTANGTNVHPTEDAANPDLSMSSRPPNSELSSDSMECRRIFVACYGICAAVAFSLRRPAMMRMTTYTGESLEFLETSTQAVPGDRVLVAWVRLVAISEEIRDAFSYEDSGGMTSILGLTTQQLMTAFDRRIQEWRSVTTQTDNPPCLENMYHTIRLFVHELVLHLDYSPEDFKAPYQMGPLQPCEIIGDLTTKVGVGSIVALTESSHALLELFLRLHPATARAMPVFSYVRMSYAVFLLAKLHLSASSKQSRLFSLIDRDSLRAKQYVDRAILHIRTVIGDQACRVPSIFLALLFKLRQWCQRPEMVHQGETSNESSGIWPYGFATAQKYLTLNDSSLSDGCRAGDTSFEAMNGDRAMAAVTSPVDLSCATGGRRDLASDTDPISLGNASAPGAIAAAVIPYSLSEMTATAQDLQMQLDQDAFTFAVPATLTNPGVSTSSDYNDPVASSFFAP